MINCEQSTKILFEHIPERGQSPHTFQANLCLSRKLCVLLIHICSTSELSISQQKTLQWPHKMRIWQRHKFLKVKIGVRVRESKGLGKNSNRLSLWGFLHSPARVSRLDPNADDCDFSSRFSHVSLPLHFFFFRIRRSCGQ